MSRAVARSCSFFWPFGRFVRLSCLGALAMLGLACGHEATETDCQLIADRIVELELRAQNITDAAEIQRRRNETLGLGSETNRKALLDGCVGRRISNRALGCVRSAKTADEITDKCLQ